MRCVYVCVCVCVCVLQVGRQTEALHAAEEKMAAQELLITSLTEQLKQKPAIASNGASWPPLPLPT
jgi:hypothetical protein